MKISKSKGFTPLKRPAIYVRKAERKCPFMTEDCVKAPFSQTGFTLIEVMAGLIILAIGLLAIATLYITSTKGSYFSSNVTQATIFAQDKMEYLKNLSYNDSYLSNGQYSEGTLSGTIFSRQYQVVEDAGNSMKTITVIVSWTDRGNHSLSFSTIRAK